MKRVKQRNLATCQVNLGQNLLWPILLTWICILPSFALKTLHIFVARALTWFKFLNKYEKVLFWLKWKGQQSSPSYPCWVTQNNYCLRMDSLVFLSTKSIRKAVVVFFQVIEFFSSCCHDPTISEPLPF